jgi:apolipoprotein N-acyltransferase
LLGRDRDGRQMMNAVVHVAPQRQAIYAKERLVPGAEYIPWPALIQPLLARLFDMRLKSQLSAPAELTQALYVDGHLLGVGICHELSFPLTMAERARDANMLVSVAEDNWIPSAAYRSVMWRVAQLRAAEAAKPVVRASNGMAAMWVDASGRMHSATTRPTESSASAEVLPRDGATPYHLTAWLQAAAPLGLLLLSLAVGAWRWLQDPAGPSGQPHHQEGKSR